MWQRTPAKFFRQARVTLALCTALVFACNVGLPLDAAENSDDQNSSFNECRELLVEGERAQDVGNSRLAEQRINACFMKAKDHSACRELQARAALDLGWISLRANQNEQARPWFEQAIALSEQCGGTELKASSKYALGYLCFGQNHNVEAEPFLREAIAGWQSLADANVAKTEQPGNKDLPSSTQPCLDGVNDIYVVLSRPTPTSSNLGKATSRANNASQEALVFARVGLGDALIMAERLLSCVLTSEGKLVEGDKWARSAEKLSQAQVKAERKSNIAKPNSSAEESTAKDRISEGSADVPAAQTAEKDPAHSAFELSQRAIDLDKDGKMQEAESVYRESLKVASMEPDFANSLFSTVVSFGNFLSKHEREEEARELYESYGKKIQSAKGEKRNPFNSWLCPIYVKEGRSDEVVRIYRDDIAETEHNNGPDTGFLIPTLSLLGSLLIKQGHAGDAEPYLRRCVDIATLMAHEAKQLYPHASGGTLCVYLQQLGDCYLKEKKFAEAESTFQRLISIDTEDKTPAALVRDYERLAVLYEEWGKITKALEYRQRAVEAMEKATQMKDEWKAQVLNEYARVLRLNHKEQEAAQIEARAKSLLGAFAGEAQ